MTTYEKLPYCEPACDREAGVKFTSRSGIEYTKCSTCQNLIFDKPKPSVRATPYATSVPQIHPVLLKLTHRVEELERAVQALATNGNK